MQGRTILVTGGGAGIGKAAALLAAQQGARVAVLDVDLDSATATAEEAAGLGAGGTLPVRCDVSVETDVGAAVTACVKELGTPYGVFANAGVDRAGMVHELTVEHWTGLIAINLTGVFLTCKHALKAMLAAGTGGSIVCTSSPASLVAFGAGGASAYSASKGGVSALVRCMALDYARHGIRVNAIVPGPTHTRLMWANVPEPERPAMQRVIDGEVPIGRMASPEEIAQSAIWLMSDAASYVTGSHLVCDGGVLAKASISV
jgi:NAD(P)-dependent dehydrogenase (short-subunit alcohol dehydrogenase family)